MTIRTPPALPTIVAALMLSPLAAAGQTVDRSNGEAGATILGLVTSPRAAALGGALTAAEGISSIFANPAGASTVHRFGAHLAAQSLFEGAQAGELAIGFRRNVVAAGVSVRYADLGSVEETVCDNCGGRGTTTGRSLGATEQAIGAVAAVALRDLGSVGVSVHHYSSSMADASGSAISFGVGARARAGAFVTLGASAQYLGGNADVGGFAAPMPRQFRLGAEVRPFAQRAGQLHLALAGDFVAARGAPGRFGAGAEVGIVRPASQLSAVARSGFASGSADFATAAMSFGGGLRYQSFALDYAFQASDVLGALHRVGVTVER